MKKLIILIMAVFVSSASYAGTGYLVDDYAQGNNRVCIYEYLGDTTYITIDRLDICPLTYEVH